MKEAPLTSDQCVRPLNLVSLSGSAPPVVLIERLAVEFGHLIQEENALSARGISPGGGVVLPPTNPASLTE